jgi:transcriptional regulator with GAF, ATPase, and Fis domain
MEKKYRLKGLTISADGRRRLQGWRWPGNVRELSHEIERAVVLSMGETPLDFASLNATGASGSPAANAPSPALPSGADWFDEAYAFPEEGGFDIEAAILRIIGHAMKQAGGNMSAAARMLGVPRDYIRYRMKKH